MNLILYMIIMEQVLLKRTIERVQKHLKEGVVT